MVGDAAISYLEREMFTEAEAARLLQLSQATLHWWLEGGIRRTRLYKPVIREEPTGARRVTWAEFIESALLRQYRREHHVPLHEMRLVIDILRESTGTRYPLAHHQPFIGPGRHLMLEAQERAGLDPEFWLVAVAGDQPMLTPASESFIERVKWDDDIPAGWRPHADPRSPVLMRPNVRFGLPAIGGIRTEVIWEHLEEDETFEEVAGEFELTVDEVRWAHAYETSIRAA